MSDKTETAWAVQFSIVGVVPPVPPSVFLTREAAEAYASSCVREGVVDKREDWTAFHPADRIVHARVERVKVIARDNASLGDPLTLVGS
jgi:hypothetical protein